MPHPGSLRRFLRVYEVTLSEAMAGSPPLVVTLHVITPPLPAGPATNPRELEPPGLVRNCLTALSLGNHARIAWIEKRTAEWHGELPDADYAVGDWIVYRSNEDDRP